MAFKNIKLGGFTAAYVKFSAKLCLARGKPQAGKAKASTANKQGADEPSKSVRDKALANFSPTSCFKPAVRQKYPQAR
jgi:hypothetical protein